MEKFPVTFRLPPLPPPGRFGCKTFFCAIAPTHNPLGALTVYSFGSDNQPNFSPDEEWANQCIDILPAVIA
ncbi:MAG: hypothetical protein AVDCRST_MAG56-3115 [uncultured Cytophagales bacterium]|uniref:Uncharacterized protein n=1 Tax=uncultured Cytophagales bacterium TaxID=158755 RepID=A0A6J4J6D8_9SPHI|nr:MAG: hypothetical protein AVDCRST_MAG56-3115 [uncultured Cytophagales bacterium]